MTATPKSEMSRIFRDAVLKLAKDHPFARRLVNSGRLSVPARLDDSPLNTPDRAYGGTILGMPTRQELEIEDETGRVRRFEGEALSATDMPMWPNVNMRIAVYRWTDERGRETPGWKAMTQELFDFTELVMIDFRNYYAQAISRTRVEERMEQWLEVRRRVTSVQPAAPPPPREQED